MLVGSRARSLCSILKHCPTIEKLTLPLLKGPVNVQAVSETICDHCPNITDLVLVWSGGNIQDFPMRIMERMREQRLQTLKVPGFIDGSSSALSFAAFSRHSQTLQKIDFPQHQLIKSTTLQAIHISCQALEVLKAHDIYSDDNSLLLNDAVESEWVCAKIRRLEISVKVTSRGNPYYLADSTKASWTEQDHQHWGMLDKFYTQIGKLTDLEILKITSEGFYVLHDDDHLELSQDFCFPGLLALEDEATGQIGFLSRWAGLTKLRDLDGSFLVTDEEVAERMGEREVDWFVTHLPALRHASFVLLPDSEEWSESDIPEIVHSIKRRRPEIEVLDFLPW
ncbi:hypothetical protein EC991_005405 [Linnemannia zychae]|nr:hypothetical protein EC991_005405 [Linnemannia zychae]